MTVIATTISRQCIVHASDSLLTARRSAGRVQVLDRKAAKIVRVPRCRGMLAYYGFAGWSSRWTTLGWLRAMAQGASSEPQAFAEALANQLERELRSLGVQRNPAYGIGIHFAAYERVDNHWVPELFHISNWRDQSYSGLRPGGVGWSRDSYPTMFPGRPAGDSAAHRLELHKALQSGGFLQFNNGDPLLFNPAAVALHRIVQQVGLRRRRRPSSVETWRALARRPIEVVSSVVRDFVLPDYRVVGGRVCDLALTPEGLFSSTSGNKR